jgi:hypothetical protein
LWDPGAPSILVSATATSFALLIPHRQRRDAAVLGEAPTFKHVLTRIPGQDMKK